MKKVTAKKIMMAAEKLKKDGKKWHFHILTPGCTFNKDKRFALILENTSDNELFVHFSLKKPTKTGQKLVIMLHPAITANAPKSSYLNPRSVSSRRKGEFTGQAEKKVSPKARQMINRAIELNNKGFAWHHHLLFPDCKFSKDSRYWTLVFEDPLNGEIIEDRFKNEPKEALRQIEPLFYAQKNKFV